MMDQDFLGKLRANVQASLSRDRVTASDMFKQIIARPPEPSPMEIWQDFISKPAQEHQAMAQQLGRDEFLKHSDDMLTLGEQLVGPSARNLMPYLEQFVPPPDIAGPEI